MRVMRVVFLGMLFWPLYTVSGSVAVPYATQGIRVAGRFFHVHPSCTQTVPFQPIPLFVQNLFKKSFLIALGREETLEKYLSDEEYFSLGQSFLEKHILHDKQRQERFFVYAHYCMETMWNVHPKNPEYTLVADFKKLKEVRRAVQALMCEVRKLCKQ